MKWGRICERLTLDENVTLAECQGSLAQYAFAASFVRDKVTLDIACGAGHGTKYLKQKGAKIVIGGDISPEALEVAKKVCNGYSGTGFILADATELPFPDATFEAIVSIETLEHLKAHDRFLEECKRVLKDGGIFVCTTPNRQVPAYVAGKPVNPYHINELSLPELESLLNRHFAKVKLWRQDY